MNCSFYNKDNHPRLELSRSFINACIDSCIEKVLERLSTDHAMDIQQTVGSLGGLTFQCFPESQTLVCHLGNLSSAAAPWGHRLTSSFSAASLSIDQVLSCLFTSTSNSLFIQERLAELEQVVDLSSIRTLVIRNIIVSSMSFRDLEIQIQEPSSRRNSIPRPSPYPELLHHHHDTRNDNDGMIPPHFDMDSFMMKMARESILEPQPMFSSRDLNCRKRSSAKSGLAREPTVLKRSR